MATFCRPFFWRKDLKKIISVFNEFSTQLKEDNVNAYASSCAFFIFLSFIPIIILLTAILPYTPITEADLLEFLSRLFPSSFENAIADIISQFYERSFTIVSVSAIATLWSAGKGVNSLIYGLNAIERYNEKRNSILVRFFATLYTVVFLAAIIFILLIMVYGGIAVDIIVGYFPKVTNLMELFMGIREVATIVLLTVIFILCYAFLPGKRHALIYQVPGAFFTSLTWVCFSYFFFLYVETFNAFSTYGSLTMIVVLLIWLYALMYLVLFGANINKYLHPFVKAFRKDLKTRKEEKKKEELEKEKADHDKNQIEEVKDKEDL